MSTNRTRNRNPRAANQVQRIDTEIDQNQKTLWKADAVARIVAFGFNESVEKFVYAVLYKDTEVKKGKLTDEALNEYWGRVENRNGIPEEIWRPREEKQKNAKLEILERTLLAWDNRNIPKSYLETDWIDGHRIHATKNWKIYKACWQLEFFEKKRIEADKGYKALLEEFWRQSGSDKEQLCFDLSSKDPENENPFRLFLLNPLIQIEEIKVVIKPRTTGPVTRSMKKFAELEQPIVEITEEDEPEPGTSTDVNMQGEQHHGSHRTH